MLTPTAYFIPAEKLAVGDVVIGNRYLEDATIEQVENFGRMFEDHADTIALKMTNGSVRWFLAGEEVKVTA